MLNFQIKKKKKHGHTCFFKPRIGFQRLGAPSLSDGRGGKQRGYGEGVEVLDQSMSDAGSGTYVPHWGPGRSLLAKKLIYKIRSA